MLYASYYDPIIDKQTKLITQDRCGLVFGGQFHSQGYKIFRKEAINVTLDNSDWADSQIDTFTTLAENGFIDTTYFDLTVLKNKVYVYRVSAYDIDNDASYSTGSFQSKIFDDVNDFALNSNIVNELYSGIETSKITIGDHKFKKNSYCVIEDSITPASDGFYVIIDVDETGLWVYPQINETAIGSLYYTTSVANTVL